MADEQRNDQSFKRDQQGSRDSFDELGEAIRPSGTQPRIQQPNRDRARGDWDRSGDHHDEDANLADEEPFGSER
jgi:hypothetical protein